METIEVYLSDAHKLHGKVSAHCDVVGSWCCLSVLLLRQDRHPCLGIGRFPEASHQAADLVPSRRGRIECRAYRRLHVDADMQM